MVAAIRWERHGTRRRDVRSDELMRTIPRQFLGISQEIFHRINELTGAAQRGPGIAAAFQIKQGKHFAQTWSNTVNWR